MVLETCYVIVVRAFYAILPESRVKLELTCRRAGEMNIVSVMGSLSNCARLTFIMRCTLYQIWALNLTTWTLIYATWERWWRPFCPYDWIELCSTDVAKCCSSPWRLFEGLTILYQQSSYMDFVFYLEFISSDPCIRLNQLKGPIHLNWIVELLAKPSLKTYWLQTVSKFVVRQGLHV